MGFASAILTYVVVSIFWAASAHADSQTERLFEVSEFRFLKINDYKKEKEKYGGKEGGTPSAKRMIRANPISRIVKKWKPSGTSDDPYSLECHPREMAKAYLQLRGDHSDKGRFLRDYFARCEDELSRNTSKSLVSLAAYKRIDFDVLKTRQVEPFEVVFKNGSTARGFIAFKQGAEPRPMIVFKCGLYCEADSRAATVVLLYLHLFEENPFHLMILENHTSSSSMVRNDRFVLGGFYEGQEIFEIGRWVREDAPFRHRISDLHLIGASMGGGAAAFGALVNSWNSGLSGGRVYDSALAFCGMVNLNETMHEIFQRNFRSFFFAIRAFTKMKEVRDVPELNGLVHRLQFPQPEKYPELVAEASRRFLSQFQARQYFAPFHEERPIETIGDFWDRNSIVNYSHMIRTPLLVWSSKDDWMVPYQRNTGLLARKHGDDDPFVQTIGMPYGNHCGTSLMYGWETTQKLLRAYFIDNSPNFKFKFMQQTAHVNLPNIRLNPGEVHVAQKWLAKPEHVELIYTVWDGKRRKCAMQGPFQSPRKCYKHRVVKMDWDVLRPLDLWAPAPGLAEESLTRWMNANIEVLGDHGPLMDSREMATRLAWWPR